MAFLFWPEQVDDGADSLDVFEDKSIRAVWNHLGLGDAIDA